jgi:hypothetical protein
VAAKRYSRKKKAAGVDQSPAAIACESAVQKAKRAHDELVKKGKKSEKQKGINGGG